MLGLPSENNTGLEVLKHMAGTTRKHEGTTCVQQLTDNSSRSLKITDMHDNFIHSHEFCFVFKKQLCLSANFRLLLAAGPSS